MELVKVLELGGLERQVVSGKSNSSTHHHQFCFKVLHHVAKEVVTHFMELLVIYLAHFQSVLELIAQTDNQLYMALTSLTLRSFSLPDSTSSGLGKRPAILR